MIKKNIRFAVLGTAKIARTIAPKIHSATGAELLGIASRSASSAEAFASEFEIPRSYDSYQAALDDDDVDAVYIPLPPSLHLEWTSRAAAAGKHVLCEKPLAANSSDTDEMITVCRKHGVALLDGVMWYHTPRCRKIREVVASGQLGELRHLASTFTFRWDTMPMDNLRLHRELGGGAILDLGWYCVGVTLMLFDQLPLTVTGQSQWQNDVDTRTTALLSFPDGRTATIECGFDAVRRRWFEVVGSKEALFCRDFTRPYNNDHPAFETVTGDGTTTETVVPHKPQEECMVEAFCKLVRDRSTDHPWLELASRTQLVCDAIDRSARDQTTVRLI